MNKQYKALVLRHVIKEGTRKNTYIFNFRDMFYCSVCLLDATAAMRLSEIGEDTTRSDPIFTKNIPPSIKYKLSVSSTLCRYEQTDWLHLSLTLGSLTHSCCSGQCGHAASSWVKKSGGGEEVFMIKSIVGWHNNTQLISSLVSGRRRLSQPPGRSKVVCWLRPQIVHATCLAHLRER